MNVGPDKMLTTSLHALSSGCCGFMRLWLAALLFIMPPAYADQYAKELPSLFEQLLLASEPASVSGLESEIWQHWLTAPDINAGQLMSQISRAMSAGKLQMALTLCNQLLDSTPDFAEAWNKRATIHYLMGNNTASVEDIRETVIREPRHFGAISGLGLIFLRENNIQAALDAFEEVLVISPGSQSAQNSVDRVRRELGLEI